MQEENDSLRSELLKTKEELMTAIEIREQKEEIADHLTSINDEKWQAIEELHAKISNYIYEV